MSFRAPRSTYADEDMQQYRTDNGYSTSWFPPGMSNEIAPIPGYEDGGIIDSGAGNAWHTMPVPTYQGKQPEWAQFPQMGALQKNPQWAQVLQRIYQMMNGKRRGGPQYWGQEG